ncbi:MAG: hypothetical protein P1U56_12975 [Saprospiraceae bacterium]|nr:hypothetical protein [Saprospiraceae bacterium]
MNDVIQFHNLSHIFISLIGATLLLVIYFNIRKRFSQILEEGEKQKRVDRGLLYLSLAMFVWVCSGLWAYLGSRFSFDTAFVFQVGVNLLSIVNNMFLLLALYYFYYAPAFIYKNERNVRIIIGIIILVTGSTLAVSYFGGGGVYKNVNISSIPDLLLSGFLCYLLMVSMYKTFLYRGLRLVAILSAVVVTLIFLSQLPEVFLSMNDAFSNYMIKIVAKTSLISLFLVLATTWVIQLANTPRVNEMQLTFLDWSLIQISIPSKNMDNKKVDFGSRTTQYKNLLKFAIRRKYGNGDDSSMSIGASGEIKNQTYLSRIIDDINEIGGQEENTKLERRDLFTFIGEGKYRLRMLPEHITVDQNVLQEFIAQSENRAYSSFL